MGMPCQAESDVMSSDLYAEEGPGRDLVEAGADMTGSAVGAAVGLLFGGPVGALSGAAVGPAASRALRWAAVEVGQRVLGHRERVRAGAAALFAAERLKYLLEGGSNLRDDGFFEDKPGGRNAGREIAEGVLLKACNAFEERKVRHIGYLFADIAVLDDIDAGLAALALHRAESLTWRQYVLLAAVGRADRLPLPAGELGDDPGGWAAWGTLREFRDLREAGYLRAEAKKTAHMGLTVPNTALPDQRLAHQGLLLHQLLALDVIPDNDVLAIHTALEFSHADT